MKLRALFLTLTAILCSSTAWADSPYSPKKASISDVIKQATYDRVPLQIPEFKVLSTRTVVNKKRLDFELTYDVAFWDLVEWFEKNYKDHKFVSVLDPQLFPNAKSPQLRVYGKSGTGEMMRFTLGHPDLPYRFDIRVRPDDQSKAVVIIHNAVYSAVYSGLMPARAPFVPAGKAKPINFRWN